jgi:hypothetical protein
MRIVEPTAKNWEIYSQLCELDAEYRVCDESRKEGIIAKALQFCDELEIDGDDVE